MAATGSQLAQFVDAWTGLAPLLTQRDVERAGRSPWASISQGAAGHAYALWHIGHRRRDTSQLAGSRRWLRLAVRAAKRRSGFRGPQFQDADLSASVPFGRPGLHVIEALVAHDRGKPGDRDAALTRFATAMRRAKSAPAEYMMGLAGGLLATLVLLRHTGAPTMRVLADELAGRLTAAPPIPVHNFAHGNAGVLHAVLAWSRLPGATLPGQILARAEVLRDDDVVAVHPKLIGSWCNGLPGLALLWVQAYEVTGDARWLARARATGHRLRAQPDHAVGTLCCGVGGRAYAALALSRVDRTEDWRAEAAELAATAIALSPDHGVFRGLSGLACLAADLTTPGHARFPLVEV